MSLEHTLKTLNKTIVIPTSPLYMFKYQDETLKGLYDEGWNLKDIFLLDGVGVQTGRDKLTIHFSKGELLETLRKFAPLSPEQARNDFELGEDSRDWQVVYAQRDLINTSLNPSLIREIAYRPFDNRFTYYTGKSKGFYMNPRYDVMQHIITSDNIGFLTCRQTISHTWTHAFISNYITNDCVLSNQTRERAYLFPLYRYEKPEGLFANGGELMKTENLTTAFRHFLDQQYHKPYTPEEILGYIYAVLHSPTYRAKYAEFLKIDFPRIPFTENSAAFEALSNLGWQLMQAHLLNAIPASELGSYSGEGDNTVIKPDYRIPPHPSPKLGEGTRERLGRLYINQTQYFDRVPENVYQFHLGGYQVLDKYLKDRKGRTLTLSEVKNIKNIMKVLAFTIAHMQQIDDVAKDWI